MKQLREKLLKAIEDFEEGKIDSSQLGVLAKATESIVSSLKSEMQYAILTNQQPNIPFYGQGSGISLEHKVTKKLL